ENVSLPGEAVHFQSGGILNSVVHRRRNTVDLLCQHHVVAEVYVCRKEVDQRIIAIVLKEVVVLLILRLAGKKQQLVNLAGLLWILFLSFIDLETERIDR